MEGGLAHPLSIFNETIPFSLQNRSETMEKKPTVTDSVPNPSRLSSECAANRAKELAVLLGQRDPFARSDLYEGFRLLEDLIESNPIFSLEQMVYLRNRLASSRALVASNEFGPAAYQMRELARKLHRWEDGEGSERPLPTIDRNV
jgi:hypothetical protein